LPQVNNRRLSYALLIAKHPAKMTVSYFLVSSLLAAIALYFGLNTISHNPVKIDLITSYFILVSRALRHAELKWPMNA
jgi:hypothetical protein